MAEGKDSKQYKYRQEIQQVSRDAGFSFLCSKLASFFIFLGGSLQVTIGDLLQLTG